MTVYILVFNWFDFWRKESEQGIVGVYDTRIKAEQAKTVCEAEDEKMFYGDNGFDIGFDYTYRIKEMKVQ